MDDYWLSPTESVDLPSISTSAASFFPWAGLSDDPSINNKTNFLDVLGDLLESYETSIFFLAIPDMEGYAVSTMCGEV